MPELIDYVSQNGYLTQKAIETQHMDESWQATHKKAADLQAVCPDCLPNTYLKYYLYPDYVVEHSNPDYTRANEVMDGREKKVFGAARSIIEAGEFKGCELRSTIMLPLSWIWPELLPTIPMKECCVLWKTRELSQTLILMPWWRCRAW
jgi:alpha-galactosidase/6-phospho-beta-glucosidase family protein